MSFLKPDPPTPPNPYQTASAQTGTNVATAIANNYLGHVNQNTPAGSLDYSTTGNYAFTDPSSGVTYQIPQFTATQNYTPLGQATFDQQQQTQYNLANLANNQSAYINNFLGQGFNAAAGAPAAGSAQGLQSIPSALTSFSPGSGSIQSSFDPGGAIQTSLKDAGPIATSFAQTGEPIQTTYGPADNFSADRQRVEDALMARMNPQLNIQQQGIQQQLADQGIRYGSPAYSAAMLNYSQQANDARWGAIQNAGQEQQRMTDEAQQLAVFQNAAQNQDYTQLLGRANFQNAGQLQNYNEILGTAQFNNAAVGQQFGQNQALAQFNNAAQGQQFSENMSQAQFNNQGLAAQLAQQQSIFNAQQAARSSYLGEQYAAENQPINQISSLLSGSQVQQPGFIQTGGSQIPTTDLAGLLNTNYNQQFGAYQQQSQNVNSTVGGLLGLGAGIARGPLLSDVRTKENISKMGTVLAANPAGIKKPLPIYQYSYKDDPASTAHIGPMAQDVEKITPQAVEQHDGIKYIKPKQVMGSILRAG